MLALRSKNLLRDGLLFSIPLLLVIGVERWWIHFLLQKNPSLLIDSVWKSTQSDPWGIVLSLSSFPKYVFNAHMGLLLHALIGLPIWCLLFSFARRSRLMTMRNILCSGFLFLTAVFATQTFNSTRYFLPGAYFLPLLLVLARPCIWKVNVSSMRIFQWAAVGFFSFMILYWAPFNLQVEDLKAFASGEAFNPTRVTWALFWPKLLIGAGMIAAAAAILLKRVWTWRDFSFVGGVIVLVTLFMFCNYVHSYEDVYGSLPQQSYLRSQSFTQNQMVLQLGFGMLAWLAFARRAALTWRRWYGGWLGVFLVFCFFNTHWRDTWPELFSRHYEMVETARRIKEKIPPDSIVVGQRASTLLRASTFRIGFCSGNGHQTFIPNLVKLFEREPGREIYWVLESDWDPFWTDYIEQAQDKFQVQTVETYSLRSMLSSLHMPVYLVRLTARSGPPTAR